MVVKNGLTLCIKTDYFLVIAQPLFQFVRIKMISRLTLRREEESNNKEKPEATKLSSSYKILNDDMEYNSVEVVSDILKRVENPRMVNDFFSDDDRHEYMERYHHLPHGGFLWQFDVLSWTLSIMVCLRLIVIFLNRFGIIKFDTSQATLPIPSNGDIALLVIAVSYLAILPHFRYPKDYKAVTMALSGAGLFWAMIIFERIYQRQLAFTSFFIMHMIYRRWRYKTSIDTLALFVAEFSRNTAALNGGTSAIAAFGEVQYLKWIFSVIILLVCFCRELILFRTWEHIHLLALLQEKTKQMVRQSYILQFLFITPFRLACYLCSPQTSFVIVFLSLFFSFCVFLSFFSKLHSIGGLTSFTKSTHPTNRLQEYFLR